MRGNRIRTGHNQNRRTPKPFGKLALVSDEVHGTIFQYSVVGLIIRRPRNGNTMDHDTSAITRPNSCFSWNAGVRYTAMRQSYCRDSGGVDSGGVDEGCRCASSMRKDIPHD